MCYGAMVRPQGVLREAAWGSGQPGVRKLGGRKSGRARAEGHALGGRTKAYGLAC